MSSLTRRRCRRDRRRRRQGGAAGRFHLPLGLILPPVLFVDRAYRALGVLVARPAFIPRYILPSPQAHPQRVRQEL